MRLGRFEFCLWSIGEVILFLRKWCIPDKCSICCSFKFSKWKVPVLHRSEAEKAMKASSGSDVWGCSELLGHCQGPAPLRTSGTKHWDAIPKMTPQGGACLFLQTCHDKDETSGACGVTTEVLWHGWSLCVDTDSVALAYQIHTKTLSIYRLSSVQQLCDLKLSDPLAPTGDTSVEVTLCSQ